MTEQAWAGGRLRSLHVAVARRRAAETGRECSGNAGQELRLLVWERGLRQLLLIRRIQLLLLELLLLLASSVEGTRTGQRRIL